MRLPYGSVAEGLSCSRQHCDGDVRPQRTIGPEPTSGSGPVCCSTASQSCRSLRLRPLVAVEGQLRETKLTWLPSAKRALDVLRLELARQRAVPHRTTDPALLSRPKPCSDSPCGSSWSSY